MCVVLNQYEVHGVRCTQPVRGPWCALYSNQYEVHGVRCTQPVRGPWCALYSTSTRSMVCVVLKPVRGPWCALYSTSTRSMVCVVLNQYEVHGVRCTKTRVVAGHNQYVYTYNMLLHQPMYPCVCSMCKLMPDTEGSSLF